MKKIIMIMSVMVGMGLLTSCASVNSRLTPQTYAATDRVMGSVDNITAETPILVGTITDVDYLETSSTFGRVVAEQIASRLTQTGYNVTELKMRTSLNIKDGRANNAEGGEYLLSRDVDVLKGEHKAALAITGTYAVAGQDIYVNLKLLDIATGKILGSTDYAVAKNANTMRLISGGGSLGSESFFGTSMAY